MCRGCRYVSINLRNEELSPYYVEYGQQLVKAFQKSDLRIYVGVRVAQLE